MRARQNAVALVALLATACGGMQGDPTPSTTAVTGASDETPEATATAAFDAWREGDQDGALRVATAFAAAKLFAVPSYEAEGLAPQGCKRESDDTITCGWTNPASSATLTFQVSVGPGNPEVTDATFTKGT